MKKFLLYTGITLVTLVCGIYLAFLFILPNVIDLNKYIPMLKNIVKEQTNLDVEIIDPRIVTTPHLHAGIKTGNVIVKLPDGSTLLNVVSLKARISIPQLFLLTVKVPCLEVNSPIVNLEIAKGEQFKIVRVVEDILNKQKNLPPKEESSSFDPSIIKIKIPNVKINNYTAVINDLKSSHRLVFTGEELNAGYNNGKTVKFKTNARLLSDDKVNITAKVDINSFIPPAKPQDPDDDPAEKIELPFVNPVLVYRDYDLKSNIDTKLHIRQNKENKIFVNGYLNVDNITMNLSGLQLPESSINAKFKNTLAKLDMSIFPAKNQSINLLGNIDYGKNPKADLSLITDRIFFNDMIILSKAFLDTLHIKNDLANLTGKGYWIANTQFKTDFKKLKSKGCVIARDGSVINGTTKLVFDKINANLILEDDIFKIVDTHAFINDKILKIEGTIDSNSYTDIKVNSDDLPLSGLFTAFAPADLKKSINLSSGTVKLNSVIQGELKKAIASLTVVLNNLTVGDKANSFVLNDEKLVVGLVTDLKTLDTNITNKNLTFNLPATGSHIKVPTSTIRVNEKNISLEPLNILVNDTSNIKVAGLIGDYVSKSVIDIFAEGDLDAKDLRKFLGRDAEPFVDAKGVLPLKAKVYGDNKKQTIVLQVKADNKNYITPIELSSLLGKDSLLQARIEYKGDRLHIRKTGLYTNVASFSDDLDLNMEGVQKVADVSGTIVSLNTPEPFINMIKLEIPKELSGKVSAFKNSSFNANGNLLVFGKLNSPLMKGKFNLLGLKIPEILTSMDELNIDFSGKNIFLNIKELLLNGSDIAINLKTDINPHPVFTISKLDVNSRSIDLDKLVKVPENLAKYMAPPQQNSKPASDIPVEIKNGLLDLRRIKTGNIIATNTKGDFSLSNNNFFLANLRTNVFDGVIRGNIGANLITMALDIKTQGRDLDVEKAMLDALNMKDMLAGSLDFNTDLSLSGLTFEEQVKSLKGNIDFKITDGQLGPFGKLENMILAENIRESQFFQTALGGVINNLTTIDTSHFNLLVGEISFSEGVALISPITSIGNVMSLHISGDFDILKNTTDMKVRAKLGSAIANMLGPIAQLNPINLVQVTPGLNVVMAQAFSLFCEELTAKESAALPKLPTKLDDDLATKFQIVLRGDVAKPLTLVKSFKWLALSSEIEQAKGFVSSLPDPSLVEDPNNATIEEILKAQELKAKEDAKLINKMKKFLSGDDL